MCECSDFTGWDWLSDLQSEPRPLLTHPQRSLVSPISVN